MAKHPKRRRRNWQTIEVHNKFPLDAGFASEAGLSRDLTDNATENFIATSLEATYTLAVEQAAEPNGVGPLMIGIAKSDYTIAEISEWVTNTSGFTRADLRQQEISKRHIKHVGEFHLESIASAAKLRVELNDGLPIKTPLNWRILTGTQIQVWIFNNGDVSVVATGGQDLFINGQINGFWED